MLALVVGDLVQHHVKSVLVLPDIGRHGLQAFLMGQGGPALRQGQGLVLGDEGQAVHPPLQGQLPQGLKGLLVPDHGHAGKVDLLHVDFPGVKIHLPFQGVQGRLGGDGVRGRGRYGGIAHRTTGKKGAASQANGQPAAQARSPHRAPSLRFCYFSLLNFPIVCKCFWNSLPPAAFFLPNFVYFARILPMFAGMSP